MVDNSLESTETVTTLSGQLSDGVALHNPSFEPHSTTQMLVENVLPNKGQTADETIPALFALSAFSIALDTN